MNPGQAFVPELMMFLRGVTAAKEKEKHYHTTLVTHCHESSCLLIVLGLNSRHSSGKSYKKSVGENEK